MCDKMNGPQLGESIRFSLGKKMGIMITSASFAFMGIK